MILRHPLSQVIALLTFFTVSASFVHGADHKWARVNHGNFYTYTTALQSPPGFAYKGITVPLGDGAFVLFDTDLLRVTGWLGSINEGRPGNSGYARVGGKVVFSGYASPAVLSGGKQRDPRDVPFGPLPRSWARYKGAYVYGNKTIFSWRAGETDVLESHALENVGDQKLITRTLTIGPGRKPLEFVVADRPGHTVAVHGNTAAATFNAEPAVANPFAAKANRIASAGWSDQSWNALPVGQARKPKVIPAFTEFAAPYPRGGGKAGQARTTWAAAMDGDVNTTVDLKSRMVIDLGATMDISQIHIQSTTVQSYTLVLGRTEQPDGSMQHYHEGGWKFVANVSSPRIGKGNRFATAAWNPGGDLGKARYVLIGAKRPMTIADIAVLTPSDQRPTLSDGTRISDPTPLHVRLQGVTRKAGAAGTKLDAILVAGERGRILCRVEPGDKDTTIKISYQSGSAIKGVPTAPKNLRPLTRGKQVNQKPIVLKGKRADDKKAYVLDDIPIPFKNEFRDPMQTGGFDFFSDGTTAAVCTMHGSVWIVSGIDDKLDRVTWKRFASGLFETMGLKIVDDKIYVNGRDQITRLHDLNNDGHADFHECFNNDVKVTSNWHEFAFDLHTDPQGDFYFTKAGPVPSGGRGFQRVLEHHGKVLKLSKDGSKLEVFASGFRVPNGMGVGPKGEVTTGENEGTYVPRCKVTNVTEGSFHGVVFTADDPNQKEGYARPICFLPMQADSSGGGQVWSGPKWGPLSNQLFHCSYGKSSIFMVMRDTVNGQLQGGVFRIPMRMYSGAIRGRTNPRDGQLYILGLGGWQSNSARPGCIHRIRYTGKPAFMPRAMRTARNGIYITFTCDLDPELANDPDSFAIKQWNYVYGPMYGSPQISALNPKPGIKETARLRELKHSYNKTDTLEVKSARLQPDGRTVFVEIPGLKPVMQMHIKMDLESTTGQEIVYDIYNTIHQLPDK